MLETVRFKSMGWVAAQAPTLSKYTMCGEGGVGYGFVCAYHGYPSLQSIDKLIFYSVLGF
jgi:hypothetical protein